VAERHSPPTTPASSGLRKAAGPHAVTIDQAIQA